MAAGRRRRKGDETGADSLALSLATAECVAAAAGKEQEGNGPIHCGEKKGHERLPSNAVWVKFDPRFGIMNINHPVIHEHVASNIL